MVDSTPRGQGPDCNFSGDGLHAFAGASGLTIAGNYVGTNLDGNASAPNVNGINLDGADAATIGGTTAADRNVISGNGANGIVVAGSTANGNLIEGNYLGVDASGTTALGNGTDLSQGNRHGIFIFSQASDNTVGGTTAAARNIISGNSQDGLFLAGSGTSRTVIQGNYIGTDVSGTVALANLFRGIDILDADSTQVGGNAAGAGNVLSGNAVEGVLISSGSPTGAENNVIQGNFIGTSFDGSAALGNGASGVTILTANNTVGGTSTAERNVLSDNGTSFGGSGVVLSGVNATGNLVEGNFLGTDGTGTAALPNQAHGVLLDNQASNNTVGVHGGTGTGNLISGNSQDGVFVSNSATGNFIGGNFLGTNVSGTGALGNGNSGVAIVAAGGNLVGGTTPAERNLISGNGGNGVTLAGDAASNLVLGNYIGTNVSGTAALGNAATGVSFFDRASNNTIGGTAAGAGNVISTNANGIDIDGFGGAITGNVIQGNLIGTDAAGTAPLGNVGVGIVLGIGASDTLIGGTTAAARNVISANGALGIRLTNNGTTGNLVQGNFIGTDLTGTVALANGGPGVYIDGANGNTIGGDVAGAGNLISGNFAEGVHVAFFGTALDNFIQGNRIGTDVTGSTALPNSLDGVLTDAPGTLIGGTDSLARNILSGNFGSGVDIQGSGISVQGNYIGTDVTGTMALGNGSNGVLVAGGAQSNVIGTNGDGVDDALEGNLISGNSASGVVIADPGTNLNTVACNFIGTDVNGAAALANGGQGVTIFNGAQANVIGTNGDGVADAAERNLISGNLSTGVYLTGSGTNSNVVAGNYLGTDVNGTGGLGNQPEGVIIDNGAQSNRIGTNGDGVADSAERNLISANVFSGIVIRNPGTDHNIVAGNYLGTDVTGTVALGNGRRGVVIIDGPRFNRIGSDSADADPVGERNLISANTENGVEILGDGSADNVVAGNYIGTDKNGTAALGNHLHGVQVQAGAQRNRIADNLISGNTQAGVSIAGTIFQWDPFVGGNGHYYVLIPAMTWSAAEATAVGLGGHLVSILSQAEQDFLNAGILAGNPRDADRVYWIGLNDQGSPGTFTWSSGEPVTYTNWSASEPDNVAGHDFVLLNFEFGNAFNGSAVKGTWDNVAGTGLSPGIVELNSAPDVSKLTLLTKDNVVVGNTIGTAANGTDPLGNGADGVEIRDGALDNTVGGTTAADRNLISANGRHGVSILGSATTGNLVEGNYLGTDVSGTLRVGNAFTGVTIDEAPANTVGGTVAGAGNLISGNTTEGLAIHGLSAVGNLVQGNFIGSDPSGTASVPNGSFGVSIGDAVNNTVGGPTAGARNLISGNARDGIGIGGIFSADNVVQGNYLGVAISGAAPLANALNGLFLHSGRHTLVLGNVISANHASGVELAGGTHDNVVQGNFIGTDATGLAAHANTGAGVRINDGAHDNLIGGTTAAQRNLISGNGTDGVLVLGTGVTGNVVEGNYIGTDKNGTGALGNSHSGVFIELGASNNLIGGTGNLIAFNLLSGVRVGANTSDTSVNDALRGNSIHDNGALGIDLASDGVTPNTPGGPHSGPNHLQNFPVLTSVQTNGSGSTTIQGTLNGTPNTTFTLEFFADAVCDPSGFGQGQTLIATQSVLTNGSGNASFTVSLLGGLPSGEEFVSATATDPNNNTSEFAQCATNFHLVTLSGRVFNDKNDNHVQDAGEPGLANVTITLDGVAAATTNGNGDYSLANVGPGMHTVSEVVPATYFQTFPTGDAYTVPTSSGSNVGSLNFSNETVTVSRANGQTGYAEYGGNWKNLSGGFNGLSRSHVKDASGKSQAFWGLTVKGGIPKGKYEVFVSFVPAPSPAATNAPYTVYDNSKVLGTVNVDQSQASFGGTYRGVGWKSLGIFTFSSGTAYVQLSANANGAVVANGVVLIPAGAAQFLEEGAAGAGGVGAAPSPLTAQQLQPLVQEAKALWVATGLDADARAALDAVQIYLSPLSGGLLGFTAGQTVWLDPTAAGRGWFLDPQAVDPRAFGALADGEWQAPASSPAYGRVDLLTVVAHELGHVLGLPDVPNASNPGDLMDESLAPGIRRLPALSASLGGSSPTVAGVPVQPAAVRGAQEQVLEEILAQFRAGLGTPFGLAGNAVTTDSLGLRWEAVVWNAAIARPVEGSGSVAAPALAAAFFPAHRPADSGDLDEVIRSLARGLTDRKPRL